MKRLELWLILDAVEGTEESKYAVEYGGGGGVRSSFWERSEVFRGKERNEFLEIG